MKILFLASYFYPHIGGVEKHLWEISKKLSKKGHQVVILTNKHSSELKEKATVEGIKIIRFSYPNLKYIGLIFIWLEILKNRKLIKDADVVHTHDLFVWYLPFRFILPNKRIVTTVHGLEWDNPLNKISLWQKRLALKLSDKSVGVGGFLEKYLNIKFSLMTYGASNVNVDKLKKVEKSIVYVGRLEENTGLLEFLDWLKINPKFTVDFCGDGPLRAKCEKYGTVHGFCDPAPFYKKAKICVPGGYLAALEGLSYNCELKLFWNNKVKEDYWKMSPFYKLKDKALTNWAKEQTWDKITNEYLDLYNNI